MQIIEVGRGTRTAVLLSGCGVPVEHVEPLMGPLSATHRVLLPFLPGYGETPRLEPYSLEAVENALIDALSKRGVTEADVIGFSLGGYRACALATNPRFRVRRLVLLGAFAAVTNEERPLFAQFASLTRTGAVPPGLLAQRYLSPSFATARPDVVAMVNSWADELPIAVVADELDAAAKSGDLTARLRTLSDTPVLARVGELDVCVPVAKSEEIVRASANARLEIVAGAGHALLLEDFDATLSSIKSALGS